MKMERTKTVDVVFVQSSKNYIEPCSKINKILESIYKDNFVRLPEEDSILYEKVFIPFQSFSQNLFGKCKVDKSIVAWCLALLDKIISNTNFILKPNNSNRLLLGILGLINKKENFSDNYLKLFSNLNNYELEMIEKDALYLLGDSIYIDKDLLDQYTKELY